MKVGQLKHISIRLISKKIIPITITKKIQSSLDVVSKSSICNFLFTIVHIRIQASITITINSNNRKNDGLKTKYLSIACHQVIDVLFLFRADIQTNLFHIEVLLRIIKTKLAMNKTIIIKKLYISTKDRDIINTTKYTIQSIKYASILFHLLGISNSTEFWTFSFITPYEKLKIKIYHLNPTFL